MAEPEKRLERDKEHRDVKEKSGKSGGKADGVEVFYKQPAGRNRNNEQGSEGTLEYRKHALAFGCDL